jgi:tRNA(His) guanylyltransferase
MANSKYEYHKDEERATDLRFNRGTYIIVRVDGHKFHNFSAVHNFHKPNDKRALDLMVESAKQVVRTFRGHIQLAYGYSDEFSFLIRSSSSILNRRVFKITSMLPVIFATYYNSNWDRFFGDPSRGDVVERKYDAWFDARPKEYPNCVSVIQYFRWRQVDCHINNLYNTALHAITGRYIKHELLHVPESLVETYRSNGKAIYDNGSGNGFLFELKRTPITRWIEDPSKFMSSKEATMKLSGTNSSDKNEIMFKEYKINYNNELEQFKKGSIVIDTRQDASRDDEADDTGIIHLYRDMTASASFWDEYQHIFDDFHAETINQLR